jgi:hypothetical protein
MLWLEGTVHGYSTTFASSVGVIAINQARFCCPVDRVQRRASAILYHEKVRDSENVFKWVKLRVSTLFTTTDNLKSPNLATRENNLEGTMAFDSP